MLQQMWVRIHVACSENANTPSALCVSLSRPWHVSDGYSRAFQHSGAGLVPTSYLCNLWWRVWRECLSTFVSCTLLASHPQCYILIFYSFGTDITWPYKFTAPLNTTLYVATHALTCFFRIQFNTFVKLVSFLHDFLWNSIDVYCIPTSHEFCLPVPLRLFWLPQYQTVRSAKIFSFLRAPKSLCNPCLNILLRSLVWNTLKLFAVRYQKDQSLHSCETCQIVFV